ncbi:MAG TPA: hypothetical protein VGV61_04085, partial [Thermoanaerobaculia bacterium]|nr:hypothetical protein [Thermoanaerobaculia bacterium]
MHRAARRLPLGLAALALLLVAAAPSRRPPTPLPPYEQSIEVVETSVLVTPPPLRRAPALDEWRLLENGVPRTVERVEELVGDAWELAIWVDGPLCDQRALSRTLLGLAFQAEALTRAGSVRVVVADPEPRTVLAATREPRVLVRALAELSPQSLCSGEPDALLWQARGMPRATAAGTNGARPATQPATREGAATALAALRTLVERRASVIANGAGGCQASAGCALLLIAHGYPLDADMRLPAELRPAADDGLGNALSAATEDLARRLAVARWLVLALPFAPPPPVGEDDEAHRTLPREARPGPE